MGLNKLYLTKQTIISYLERQSDIDALQRDYKIEKLLSSECVVTDKWVDDFFADLNKFERKIRDSYFEEKKLTKNLFTNHYLAEKMESRAECIISIYRRNFDVFDLSVAVRLLKAQSKESVSSNYAVVKSKEEILKELIDTFD